jgi:hypothetical protein
MAQVAAKEVKEPKEPKAEAVRRPDRAEHTSQCDTIMAEILALNERAKKAKSETERILGDRGGSRVSTAAAVVCCRCKCNDLFRDCSNMTSIYIYIYQYILYVAWCYAGRDGCDKSGHESFNG